MNGSNANIGLTFILAGMIIWYISAWVLSKYDNQTSYSILVLTGMFINMTGFSTLIVFDTLSEMQKYYAFFIFFIYMLVCLYAFYSLQEYRKENKEKNRKYLEDIEFERSRQWNPNK